MSITTASKVTIGRICMIPVFVWCTVSYAATVAAGLPHAGWRHAAVWTFCLAALSDGIDGFIARHFNQVTPFGKFLDPIADKGLLLAAIITLTVCEWAPGIHFPLWYLLLILTRNCFILIGGFIVHRISGQLTIRPQWSGKLNTFAQMISVGWILLGITAIPLIYPVIISAVLAVISWIYYIRDGLRQIRTSPHAPTN